MACTIHWSHLLLFSCCNDHQDVNVESVCGEGGLKMEFRYTLQAIQVQRTWPSIQNSSLESGVLLTHHNIIPQRSQCIVCMFWGVVGYRPGKVRVWGFSIFEKSLLQGDEGKHQHRVGGGPVLPLNYPSTWTPLRTTVSPYRCNDHELGGCGLITRKRNGTVGIHLAVVMVTIATKSTWVQSVCTAHSCVTGRGWWELGESWVLMSAASHKLPFFLKSQKQAQLPDQGSDCIHQKCLHKS